MIRERERECIFERMRDERCNWRLIYYMEMEVSDRQLSVLYKKK